MSFGHCRPELTIVDPGTVEWLVRFLRWAILPWLGFFDGAQAASSAGHGGEFQAFWLALGTDRRRMRVWIGRRAAQSREWDTQILPHGAQENGYAIQKDNASRQGHAVSGISGSSSLVHGGLFSQHCGSFIASDGPRFIKLNEGTWHAGPLFGDRDSMVFYNLELSDTNVVDHTTHVFEDDVLIED